MQIGLLQAGHMADEIAAELGDYDSIYGRFLAPEGITLKTYPVVDGIFPDSPEAEAGWLISGSKHGAYDPLPWIPRLEDFIRETHARRVPMVGICFGHQIIAQALGGTVEKFAGGWAVGRKTYDWSGDPVSLNVWHQDQVTTAPDGAEVIATSDFCRIGALAVGDHILTMQPHPEFRRAETEMLLRHRAPGVVPVELIEGAERSLEQPTDDAQLARRIAEFFRKQVSHDRVA